MNANSVNVAVVDGKTITQTVDLGAAKTGLPVRIKAVQGGKYILAEGEKGVAPENITIKRVGKDLHIALEGTDPDQPQLIIENFEGSGGQLVGIAEDGSYYPYISSDGDQDRAAAFLYEGIESPQVLGAQPLTGFANGLVAGNGIGWFWPALLGLGALGLLGGIYAATRDDDKKDKTGGANGDKGSIGGAHDDVGDKQGLIENGGSTDDKTPTFTGVGRPGSSVEIVDNGKTIGTAIVGEDGKWEFTPPAPGLDDGSHIIVVVPVDPDGNKGEPSPGHEIIVDTVAPGTPRIESIIDDVDPQAGALAAGDSTNDTTPTLSGSAEAGAIVRIFDNGVEIGSVLADVDGKWSFTPETALEAGPHEFTITAEDAAGNISTPSQPFPIIIDITAPEKPGVGNGGIDDIIDNVGPVQGSIGDGDTTDDKTPTFTGGGATPGDTVIIIDSGKEIGSAIVGDDGRWEFTPDPELEDGSHDIVVVIKDPAGNESEPSDPITIIVDTTAPGKPGVGTGGIEDITDNVGPIQGSIGDGDTTDDKTPTFTGGGARPGDIIVIIDNGEEIGSAIVGDDGRWEFTPNPVLEEGAHEIEVVIRDPNGNESEPSDPITIIVDTTAPGKPGVGTGGIDDISDNVGPIQGSIGDGDTTDDKTPTFSGGGAMPGDTIIIIDNGEEIGSVIVDEDGRWEFTPDPELEEGSHDIVVVIKDPAGNESEPSDPITIIVDTTAPGKPGVGTGGIEDISDNVGPIQGSIGDGDTTDDKTPTFSGGGAMPGDTIIIIDNGTEIGSAIVGDDGRWEFTPDPELEDGSHEIVVVIKDPAGNESEPSDPITIIVDTDRPVAPTINSVVDDQGDVTGPIGAGETSDDAQPLISGSAEPGTTVIIYNNGTEIGRELVDANGNWSHMPVPPLLNGSQSLTVEAVDAAGNVSDPSDKFDFDLAAGGTPPAPSITGVADDVADGIGNIAPDGHTNDTEPQVSGTAEPFANVELFANGVSVGSIAADQFGNWTITPNPALTPGLNNLTATATNAAGNTSPTTGNYPITVDTDAPSAATDGTLTDNVGAVTGPILDGDTTDDSTPTFSGTAEPNTTLIIYNNGEELHRVQVDPDGNWSFTPSPALTPGAYSFSTVVVDAAGNRSPESTPIGFIVDTSAVTISIDQVLDNEGPVQGALASGGVTDDTTPTLSGTATPGSTVNIYLNGDLLQENVPVNSQGQWSYTVSPALTTGEYAFSATVVTPAGGESAPTADFNLEVDVTPSAAPTIDSITDDVGSVQDPLVDGSVTDDTTPTLRGTGVEGDLIIIRNNGVVIGSEVVRPDNTWTFTPNPPLNHGTTNRFDVIAQDPAGNQSEPSESWTIIVDTSAPDASAVVESMGKDSGADSGDFVTNDGSAGRLIQGSLTAALAADEKVQISTDGGATWLDALLNGDGTWSFIDQNSHSGDWTIQTRVVDAAGNSNVTSQAVSLDSLAPDAPDQFAINGITVTVTFDGSSLVEGDTILVVVGNERFEQTLTQAQIDAGSVDVVTTAGVSMTNTSASFIDQAGNSSQILTFYTSSADFEGSTPVKTVKGEAIDFGAFTFTWDDSDVGYNDPNWPRGIVAAGTTTGEGLKTPSIGLGVWAGLTQDARLTLNNGETATGVTFRIGELTSPMTLRFFDASGNQIHTHNVPLTGGPNIATVSATLPNGVEFSYIEFDTLYGQYFWLDDFVLQGTSPDGFVHNDPAANQTINDTGAYYGDDAQNVFLLSDVANLDATDSIINGGAGVDTLTLTGTGQVLDLSAIAGKLESIEIIDLTGTGDNTLNLSLGDVLEQGESSLFTADETVQMMIKGNAGDVVNLDDLLPDGTDPGDWASSGTATVAGVVYNVYQHSSLDAQLLVQDGVTTNLV